MMAIFIGVTVVLLSWLIKEMMNPLEVGDNYEE